MEKTKERKQDYFISDLPKVILLKIFDDMKELFQNSKMQKSLQEMEKNDR